MSKGWHIPSDGEWQTMEISLGMSEAEAASEGWRGTDEGLKMKDDVQWNGSNSSGFTGLPGGYRDSGGFYFDGNDGGWWSASESRFHLMVSFTELQLRRVSTEATTIDTSAFLLVVSGIKNFKL